MYKFAYKKQLNIYKKFNLDFWGYYSNTNFLIKIPFIKDKITNFFIKNFKLQLNIKKQKGRIYIYRIDLSIKKKKYKINTNQKILKNQLIKVYYLNIKENQFIKYVQKAFQFSGEAEANYIFFLEGRISNILYRMNFFFNVFNFKWLILIHGILINKQRITYINYNLKIFDFIQIIPYFFKKTRKWLKIRTQLKLIYFNTPRFFIINFNLLFGFIYKFPSVKDIALPSSIDIYQGFDFI